MWRAYSRQTPAAPAFFAPGEPHLHGEQDREHHHHQPRRPLEPADARAAPSEALFTQPENWLNDDGS